MDLLKGLGRVVEFVTDVGMFLVDGIASFINFAYNVYDGTRNIMKSIGLEGAFDAIMKAVEVAITVLTFALGAKSLGGFGGGKGGTAKAPKTRVRTKPQEAFQAGRPKRMQMPVVPGTTSQGAAVELQEDMVRVLQREDSDRQQGRKQHNKLLVS